eukprot:4450140-Prymnesium_polylepis.1
MTRGGEPSLASCGQAAPCTPTPHARAAHAASTSIASSCSTSARAASHLATRPFRPPPAGAAPKGPPHASSNALGAPPP